MIRDGIPCAHFKKDVEKIGRRKVKATIVAQELEKMSESDPFVQLT